MRLTNPAALAAVAASRGRTPRSQKPAHRRHALRRVNAHMLWAFNPQRELTTRYHPED